MNNKQKLFPLIFTVIFITVFSLFYFDEYYEFHQSKNELKIQKQYTQNLIENFQIEDIKPIEDISLFYTPDLNLLDTIVEKIKNAQSEIYLQVYILTEKRIQEALLLAYKNNISIKVILEKNPYMAANINNKAYNALTKNWIDVVRSNKDHYNYNHAKLILIDDEIILSTWNFSYSTFTKNRDFFLILRDQEVYQTLKQTFLHDYSWIQKDEYSENIIYSPSSSRKKISTLLSEAKQEIQMYFQYIQDQSFIDQLMALNEKWIEIHIILPENQQNENNIQQLIQKWINIKFHQKNKIHSKAILIDKTYLYIWSINCSYNSIEDNREIGILLKNKNIIDDFYEVFIQDIKNSF